MHIDELQYELPNALIARYPAAKREQSRLMGLRGDSLQHHRFHSLPDLLPPGALLVVNDTRVLPARLRGHKRGTGGKVEVLLVRQLSGDAPAQSQSQIWQALVRSSKRLRVAQELLLAAGVMVATVEQPQNHEGVAQLRLQSRVEASLQDLIQQHGQMPLPPYLGRAAEESDRQRYQTVFAREAGAVAAPTAGLHFSEALVNQLQERGMGTASVTLHVGPGTFKPVSCEDLNDHPMHSEWYAVPPRTVEQIAEARREGRAVIAVGTTVVRALESAADPQRPGLVLPLQADTDLLIQPGYRFQVVDGLITNFHLPGSTLLALVYAFGGVEAVRRAYQTAIAEGYRFYSYGDAMFIAERASA